MSDVTEMGRKVSSPPSAHAVRQTERPPSFRKALRSSLPAYAFLAPAGIIVFLFFFIPVVFIFWLSMTNLSNSNFTSNLSDMQFVGLTNFQTLLNDQFAKKILFNTIFYVLVTLTLFNVFLALVVSLLTTHIPRRAGFIF